MTRICLKIFKKIKLNKNKKLSSTIDGNREMDQLYTASQVYNKENELFLHYLTCLPTFED